MIHPAAHIGEVHLNISRLDRSIEFYETRLGFSLHRRDTQTAWLGAGGPDLLVLSQGDFLPHVPHATGLYHFAILVPSRRDLGRALRRLVDTRTPLQGVADHGVSESLYLGDPDGNGIEIYRDRPREQWPFVNGQLRMGADPLDLDGLLAEDRDRDERGLDSATVIGHVHLQVSRLDEAERFYADVLGFDLTQRYGPAALFVAAGGYHHHIGMNTWHSAGAPPPPPNAIGLRHFVVVLPNDAARADVEARLRAANIAFESRPDGLLVRDPSQNAILFTLV